MNEDYLILLMKRGKSSKELRMIRPPEINVLIPNAMNNFAPNNL